jgi:hypothetical protein
VILLTGVMAVVFDDDRQRGHQYPEPRFSRPGVHDSVGRERVRAGAGDGDPGQRLGMERFGAKQMWMYSLALFLASSVLSSLALHGLRLLAAGHAAAS